MGKNVFAGGLLAFTPQATESLFDDLRRVFGKRNAKKLPTIQDEDLQAVASMFTLSWLFETLDRTMGTDTPQLQNSEGDELVFHDVRFPLASGMARKTSPRR